MSLGPEWIVGRAGPTHCPSLRERCDQGHSQHPDWFALDVRDRRQRYLPAVIRRRVSTLPRDERVRGLMNGRGKQERDEPEQPDSEIGLHRATYDASL